jgi:hypothetical protein
MGPTGDFCIVATFSYGGFWQVISLRCTRTKALYRLRVETRDYEAYNAKTQRKVKLGHAVKVKHNVPLELMSRLYVPGWFGRHTNDTHQHTHCDNAVLDITTQYCFNVLANNILWESDVLPKAVMGLVSAYHCYTSPIAPPKKGEMWHHTDRIDAKHTCAAKHEDLEEQTERNPNMANLTIRVRLFEIKTTVASS